MSAAHEEPRAQRRRGASLALWKRRRELSPFDDEERAGHTVHHVHRDVAVHVPRQLSALNASSVSFDTLQQFRYNPTLTSDSDQPLRRNLATCEVRGSLDTLAGVA